MSEARARTKADRARAKREPAAGKPSLRPDLRIVETQVFRGPTGHAPRHLDRNIALVGRIIQGLEHMSSLPRGTEALGFYKERSSDVPIVGAKLASDLPSDERPRFEYLTGASFDAYLHARKNRQDDFFIRPAGGADVCNVNVPVRPVPAS